MSTSPCCGDCSTTRLRRAALIAGIIGMVLAISSTTLRARTTSTAVQGALSPAENGCLVVSLFYYEVDCSFTGSSPTPTAGKALQWVGPTLGPVYFSPSDPKAVPGYTPGEHEAGFAPPVTGLLMVDDRGTASTKDDQISGTLSIGAAMRSHLSRVNEKSPVRRAVESWLRITHTLAPTPVNSATKNARGGFDYVIALKGMPSRLCLKANAKDCFPSPSAPLITDGKWGAGTWMGPGTVPVGRSPALGGNVGTRSTAVIDSYHCTDNAGGKLCKRGIDLWDGAEDPGWDNILLTVSTDASGNIIRAEGFWTDEFRVDAGPPAVRGPPGQDNSWRSGHFLVTPRPVRSATKVQ